jgi:HEAT repeat protein
MNDMHGSHELRAAAVVALGLVPLQVSGKPTPPGSGRRQALITTREEQVRWLLGALDEVGFDPRVRAQVPVSLARLMADVPVDFPQRDLAVERIAQLMGDRSCEQIPVRRGCAQALGWLVDCDASELDSSVRALLIEAGEDASDQGVRRFAWIALARAAGRPGTEGDPLAGAPEARAALSSELAGGGTPMRPWAAVALGVLERSLLDVGREASDDVRSALRRALEDARTLEEVGACGIGIGLSRDPAAGELLRREFATTRDPETRGDLALALGMAGDRAALERLRAACADAVDQPELLLQLSKGLALIGDKQIGGRLEELLEESDSSMPASNLLASLGRIGAAHTVDRLVATIADGEQPTATRTAAVGALGRVTELALFPWTTRLSVGSAYRSGVETLTTVPRGHGVLDVRP